MEAVNDCQGKRNSQELAENLKSRLWRLNNLYWIINEQGERVKFKLRPVQYIFYMTMWWFNIILKSRQHGFTTFIAILALDMCLFNSNIRAGFVAHEQKAAQSIFYDKIKYPYENLPEIIKERVPAVKNDACTLLLANNSSIRTGVTLRSGTYQLIHVSEFGKICARSPERAKEIISGTLETVHDGAFVFIESTAEGNVGYFHDWCENAMKQARAGVKLTEKDYKLHFFAWHDKPQNTMNPDGVIISPEMQSYFEGLKQELAKKFTAGQKAWYVKKKEILGDLIYREHPSTPREAFIASVEGAYYAAGIGKLRDTGRIKPFGYDPMLPVHTFWDLGMSDSMSIWMAQFAHMEIRLIDYYENNNHGLEHYFKVLKEKPYVYGQHFGPHDMRVRELGTGLSRLEAAKQHGFIFEVMPTDKISIQDGIELVRGILPLCWINESNCGYGIKCLENYRKEYNEKLEMFEDKPLHNWASHCASAAKTLAVAYRYNKINGRYLNSELELLNEHKQDSSDWDPLMLTRG